MYVDRAFKKLEESVMSPDDPRGFLGDMFRGRRVQLEDLAAIQAHRPLKPPPKGVWFNFASPMCRAVLFERAQAEENRRGNR